ncbi:hypothetical protein EJV47_05720 [Hymenobacter gummosus]|uniref:Uncharacterized protein n=1 Tax=Hymenobacter gummosus TaxID=1776032 RepID=A0A431U722_9BACT|nr:hypothetical protein [Hymenobacter gummosus]RTQ52509.1 hypothetical protein EJV47_05720 [Hymenobacter gummosus]
MNMLTSGAPRATVYTTLGQTLRVPLRPEAPENQFISWFNGQLAANPGFPLRVRSILLVAGRAPCPDCRQALRQFLSRWQLAGKLRIVGAELAGSGACGCRLQAASPPASALEVLLGEAEQELVGPYRRVRGHHIHQSGSYGSGDARRTNPNHQAAVAMQQGVPGFTEAQHRRASAVQRHLNRGYRGRDLREKTGGVTVAARGPGRLPATPSQGFEDLKAYYALRAAGKSPAEAYQLVMQSARQLAAAGAQPVRVPSR